MTEVVKTWQYLRSFFFSYAKSDFKDYLAIYQRNKLQSLNAKQKLNAESVMPFPLLGVQLNAFAALSGRCWTEGQNATR